MYIYMCVCVCMNIYTSREAKRKLIKSDLGPVLSPSRFRGAGPPRLWPKGGPRARLGGG